MSRSNKKDVIVKKKKKDAIPLDEYDNMDYDILSENLKKDTSSVNEIKRSRNYYQLERDSVQTYYDIVKDEVEKTDSHIRNIEAQMERMQDTHRNDIRIYLQKVIHLEYEHNNNIEAVNTLSLQDSNNQQINHTKNKNQLKNLKLVNKQNTNKIKNKNNHSNKNKQIIIRQIITKQSQLTSLIYLFCSFYFILFYFLFFSLSFFSFHSFTLADFLFFFVNCFVFFCFVC